jgi:hypothetical protein
LVTGTVEAVAPGTHTCVIAPHRKNDISALRTSGSVPRGDAERECWRGLLEEQPGSDVYTKPLTAAAARAALGTPGQAPHGPWQRTAVAVLSVDVVRRVDE